ncbi:MAG: hypothetical protein RIE53_08795 [Rhodothermales bacterium]
MPDRYIQGMNEIIHRRVSFTLQGILLAGMGLALWQGEWLMAFTTFGIVLLTLLPIVVERHFNVYIPAEIELLALVFVFATLFLGEVRDYYYRFWWWDTVLHAGSGVLLGIVGFLLVYILNETERVNVTLKPGFVAFFAFLFAVGMGTMWEIFEFAMDQLFGMSMQKQMLSDPSGLSDTMWDLIVDALGGLAIAVFGYYYIRNDRRESFLERWIHDFITRNPRFFKR